MTTTLPTSIKQDIAGESSAIDCQIMLLLDGCYWSFDYMREAYGFTPEYVQGVIDRASETPAYIKQEYGIEVTIKEVYAVMREYAEKANDAWDDLVR